MFWWLPLAVTELPVKSTCSLWWLVVVVVKGITLLMQSPRKLEYIWSISSGFSSVLWSSGQPRNPSCLWNWFIHRGIWSGELFCWAWMSEWCLLPWAVKHLIAVWDMTPLCKRDSFEGECAVPFGKLVLTLQAQPIRAPFLPWLDVLQWLNSASLC